MTASRTKILMVHGMLMQDQDAGRTRDVWSQVLIKCLRKTAWAQANPTKVPTCAEIDLVFWGDLFKKPTPEQLAEIPKGLTEDVADAVYAGLRKVVIGADWLAKFGEDGRPRGAFGRFVALFVSQAAFYMHNGRVAIKKAGLHGGAFDQIQTLFKEKLFPKDGGGPAIVIGHSLGTVIAYEGLCLNTSKVDTFITIGSPLGTPHLIVEPLRKRLGDKLNRPAGVKNGLPLPLVRRWANFFSTADVLSVPVPRLGALFPGKKVEDFPVRHGNPVAFKSTHKITTYLKRHPLEIGNVIAEGLARAYP